MEHKFTRCKELLAYLQQQSKVKININQRNLIIASVLHEAGVSFPQLTTAAVFVNVYVHRKAGELVN